MCEAYRGLAECDDVDTHERAPEAFFDSQLKRIRKVAAGVPMGAAERFVFIRNVGKEQDDATLSLIVLLCTNLQNISMVAEPGFEKSLLAIILCEVVNSQRAQPKGCKHLQHLSELILRRDCGQTRQSRQTKLKEVFSFPEPLFTLPGLSTLDFTGIDRSSGVNLNDLPEELSCHSVRHVRWERCPVGGGATSSLL